MWERLVGDPALLADARRRYRGTGDLLDQLWWAEHPGEPTPAGRPDPSSTTESLRRDLYRPGGAERASGTIAERLAATQVDRELGAEAFAAAEADAASRPGEPRPGHAAARRSVPLLAAVVGAAAGVLLGIGVGVGVGDPARRPSADVTAQAYGELSRTQRPIDLVDRALIPSFVRPSSVRLLRSYSSVGTQVYGARTTGGRVCLIAVVLASDPAASCTTRAAFAAAGLSLVVRARADPEDDSGHSPADELELLWQDDGTVSITPTPQEAPD